LTDRRAAAPIVERNSPNTPSIDLPSIAAGRSDRRGILELPSDVAKSAAPSSALNKKIGHQRRAYFFNQQPVIRICGASSAWIRRGSKVFFALPDDQIPVERRGYPSVCPRRASIWSRINAFSPYAELSF
jgi:hypothetical protein